MKDWHVLITGGSAGIGLAIAKHIAAEGGVPHLTGRNPSRLEEAREQLPEGARTYEGDVADPQCRRNWVEALARHTGGRLDGLVINAAKYGRLGLLSADESQVVSYFQTNTLGAWHMVKLTHPLLLKGTGKSILFISSTLSGKPIPGFGLYAASKAAMNSLAQSFALELAGDGIRVNAILPGVVDTAIHEPQQPGDPTRRDKLSQLASVHPLGRVGMPEDVAKAAMFLLSPQASWTTGSLVTVDGGISLA